MINAQKIGARINQLRELRGLSLSALAEKAGLAKSYVAKLERGEVENPGIRTLEAVSVVLRVSLHEMIEEGLTDLQENASRAIKELASFNEILDSIPKPLKKLIASEKKKGNELTAAEIKGLAQIQYRGGHPKTVEDWRFIYDAIRRST